MGNSKKTTVRALKVLVQVVMIVEKDGEIEEISTQPTSIPAKDWATYATSLVIDTVASAEESLNAPSA